MGIRVGGIEIPRRKLLVVLAVLAALVLLSLFYRHIDVAALHARAARLNGFAVFAAVTLLPMLGFPVSVMHAVAGVRFGLLHAVPIVAGSLVLQILGSYALVRWSPDFFARRLRPLRERLPRTAHGPLTQFTLLLPGAPFFAQNYVLPLMGVPLRTFVAWALPLHLARSLVGILFGEMSDQLTGWRIAGFLAYFVVVLLACSWSFRRLRARLRDRSPAVDDPMPVA